MIGQTVSHYRILEKLGAGGMGEVYLAEDTDLRRQVALKFLSASLASDSDARARFKREAQAVAKLSHPNIITIFEVQEHEGRPFFAMEYVKGRSFEDIVKSEDLTVWQILQLAIHVSSGLSEAHKAGVVHRDIKPSNIVVAGSGSVKILDFGLATVTGSTQLTKSGSTLGTLGYMSPEQAQGGKADERSDLFSFGVVLYELITRKQPFRREFEASTVYALVNEQPEPLARYKSDVPVGLQRLVDKLLQKNPALRYQTAADVQADLRSEIERLTPPSGRTASGNPVSRGHGRTYAQTALLVVAVGTLLYLALRDGAVPNAPRHRQITFSGTASGGAVSPDGRSLAYFEEGDSTFSVLVKDLAGGSPLPIYEGSLSEWLIRGQGPVWSPDGHELLMWDWEHGNALLLSRLGGTPREYVAEASLRTWAPDGQSFFSSALSSGGRIVQSQKATGEQTIHPTGVRADWTMGIAKSPTGEAFCVIDGHFSGGSALWLTALDTTSANIVHTSDDIHIHADWSQGCNAIYFTLDRPSGVDLYKLAVDVRKFKAVDSAVLMFPNLQTSGRFSVDRERNRIYYDHRTRSSNLVLADLPDKSRRKSMVTRALTKGTGQAYFPRISPDGQTLAFSKWVDSAWQVFTMSLKELQPRQITYGSRINYMAAWSPDGLTLAYVTEVSGRFRMATKPVDGGEEHIYSHSKPSADGGMDAWWPDASTLMYGMEGNRNYSFMNLVTGEERPFVGNDSLGWMFSIVASGDGKSVAVNWNRRQDIRGSSLPEHTGIWIISRDGTQQRLLESTHGGLVTPLAWSKESDKIIYITDNSHMVCTVDTASGTIDTLCELPNAYVYSVEFLPNQDQVVFSELSDINDIWVIDDFDPDFK